MNKMIFKKIKFRWEEVYAIIFLLGLGIPLAIQEIIGCPPPSYRQLGIPFLFTASLIIICKFFGKDLLNDFSFSSSNRRKKFWFFLSVFLFIVLVPLFLYDSIVCLIQK